MSHYFPIPTTKFHFSNRETWPVYVREAIQQNLDRGIVGSAVAGILYAFRDEDDGLKYGMWVLAVLRYFGSQLIDC